MFRDIFTGLVYSMQMQSRDERFNCYFKIGLVCRCVCHIYHCYSAVIFAKNMLYIIVLRQCSSLRWLQLACVTYLRACFLASLRALLTCVALRCVDTLRYMRRVAFLRTCGRGLETGPWRSHARTPGLSGGS